MKLIIKGFEKKVKSDEMMVDYKQYITKDSVCKYCHSYKICCVNLTALTNYEICTLWRCV